MPSGNVMCENADISLANYCWCCRGSLIQYYNFNIVRTLEIKIVLWYMETTSRNVYNCIGYKSVTSTFCEVETIKGKTMQNSCLFLFGP